MERVVLEKEKHIAIMTLNNPQALNALNTGFMKEISDQVDKVEEDRDIYVLIITGAEKAFIAGADINEMKDLSAVEMLEWAKLGNSLNLRLENLRIPVIAAINGFALGGGCELAMACDIRIASEKAMFGQPEVGIGVTPGAGGTQRLPRLVGEGKAKELLYTGKLINAHEAEHIGLIQKLVPHEKLMEEAVMMAEEITRQGQIAVQQCKRAINAGLQMDINSAMALEIQGFCVCNASEDKKIGMGAFVKKEKEKHFVYR